MSEFMTAYNLSWRIIVFGGVGGTLWSLAYALYIRRGFIDKTYGIPALAIIGNFAWEAQGITIMFSLPQVNILQVGVNAVWFVLDLFIVYQLVRWGQPKFVEHTGYPGWWFYIWFALAFIMLNFLFLTISLEMNDPYGHYGSYTLNLYMSLLFIQRLATQQTVAGQSLYAGLGRQFGTGIYAVAATEFLGFRPYLMTVFISIFVFDTVYNVLLYRALVRDGIRPWGRV